MRIWDLKQGTSLHVLKGREEAERLPRALTGEGLRAGSGLCRGEEAAPVEPGAFPAELPRPRGAGPCRVAASRAGAEAAGGGAVGFRARRAELTPLLLARTGQDGHQDPLTCVASNQDGSLILTGSVDCHAKLVNSATGKVGVPVWGLLPAKSSLRWPPVASRRRAWPAQPPPPSCWGGLGAAGGAHGLSPPLPQVVCVFKMESAAPKAPAGEGEEAESNSVESLGFCNV